MPKKWKQLRRYPNIYEYQTQKGKRYAIRRHYKEFEGKYAEFTKSGFKNREDASAILKKFEDKLYSHTLPTGMRSNESVSEYFTKLSSEKLKTQQWRKITYNTFINIFNSHLKPKFGNVPLDKVTRRQYQDLINRKIEEGLARTTVQEIDHTMQLIFNNAETFDVITKNKLKHIKISGGKERKNQTIEAEEYKKWMETAKKVLPPFYFRLVRMLTLGERREELLGLHYGSFEFTKKDGLESCAIRFDIARNQTDQKGSKLKTKASYRTIVVSGEMCQDIHLVLDESKKLRLKYGQTILQDDYVAVTMAHGTPMSPVTLNRQLEKVSQKSGIKIHPHMLRHYFATVAKDQNLSDTSIMQWLGHSRVDMTNYYTRPNENSLLKVFNGMEGKI